MKGDNKLCLLNIHLRPQVPWPQDRPLCSAQTHSWSQQTACSIARSPPWSRCRALKIKLWYPGFSPVWVSWFYLSLGKVGSPIGACFHPFLAPAFNFVADLYLDCKPFFALIGACRPLVHFRNAVRHLQLHIFFGLQCPGSEYLGLLLLVVVVVAIKYFHILEGLTAPGHFSVSQPPSSL